MRKIIIMLLCLLFILAACQEQENTNDNSQSFIGGSSGLLINFQEGEPPIEVTDGAQMDFTATVKLENQGEAEVASEDISLTLKGFDAISFGVEDPAALQDVNPSENILANNINPDTGEAIDAPPVYYTFPILNYQEDLSGNSVFPFVVDVCYNYQTLATASLCVKEDLLDSTDADVCTVSGTKDVQNSGAPVHITEFKEFTAGQDKVSFSFTVKNVGNGLLSDLNKDCDQTPANKDYVTVIVDTHLDGLTCSGLTNGAEVTDSTAYSGKVKLTTGEKQVRCTQTISEADRTDKVMITDFTLNYDYQESTRKQVLVKHI